MSKDELFYFDPSHLESLGKSLAYDYQHAEPFAHTVIDNLLPAEVADSVLGEFPSPDSIEWINHDNAKELKLACEDETKIAPFTRHLLAQLNSSTFMNFLESLTGITGLIPDPHFRGGGLHQIKKGGYLKIHADFNHYKRLNLDRRINLLLYFNKDWKEEYGGHLQLWDRDMTQCQKKVLPILNRCVIFSTTDFTNHGHPDPLTCPEGWTRKSLALYYYSNGRPQYEISQAHSTLYQERPGEYFRRHGTNFKNIAKQFIPPIILTGMKATKRFILGS